MALLANYRLERLQEWREKIPDPRSAEGNVVKTA